MDQDNPVRETPQQAGNYMWIANMELLYRYTLSARIMDACRNDFHVVSRQLHTILVCNLFYDSSLAIKMIAFWLWLERVGFMEMMTPKILALPFQVISRVGDEALRFWAYISDDDLSPSSSALEIPLTHAVLKREMSIQFLCNNRMKIIVGISEAMEQVHNCLKDVIEQANNRNTRPSTVLGSMAQPSLTPQQQLQNANVHPDNRTMFVTFSKGYPVAEWEVRDFFIQLFGNCIEGFFMQEVPINDQPLFAKIVFYQASYIDIILHGLVKAKYTINGKHVWMRKFIPRRPRRLAGRR